jgi:hypothetical protein
MWILGAVLVLAGLGLRLSGDGSATGMIVPGLVILAAMALERWRYRPRTSAGSSGWDSTGERFVDPETNRLMEVQFNPRTGERRYSEVADDARKDGAT